MLRVLTWIDTAVKALVTICCMLMAVTVLAGVFFRYVLHSSLPWTEELPRFLMIWMAMYAGPLALEQGVHVSFDGLVDKLSAKAQLVIYLFTRLLVVCFLAVLVVKGFSLMETFSFQKAPTLGISYAIPYSAVPLAATLFLIKYSVEIAKTIRIKLAADAAGARR